MMVYLIGYPDQGKNKILSVLRAFVVQSYFLLISDLRPLTSDLLFLNHQDTKYPKKDLLSNRNPGEIILDGTGVHFTGQAPNSINPSTLRVIPLLMLGHLGIM